MKYKNTKTQAVIEIACVIFGDDWVKVEDQPVSASKQHEKKSKKDGE